MSLISSDNEVFRNFAFYGGIVVIKMVLMSPITTIPRMMYKAYQNPEEARRENVKVNRNNESVERVRRVHLNDIENIVPFFCVGLLYVTTNPSPSVALSCFRLFAVARIGHSIAHLGGIFLPRLVCFSTGLGVNLFMGINVIRSFM